MLEDKITETKRLISAIEEIENSITQQNNIVWDNLFDRVKYAKHESVEKSMMLYYDERAEEYDAIYVGDGPASCKPEVYKKDVAALLKLLSDFGQGKVIDIGCGTGYWLEGYYENCKEFTFLDRAPHMLDKCKERVEDYKLMEHSEFICEDFLKWEKAFPHSYDCAVVGFLLGHFMTLQEAAFFHRLKSILKPKGKLIIIDNTWSKWRAKDEYKEDIEQRTLSDGRQFSIYKKYFEEEEIKEIFNKYEIQVEKVYWGLNFFGIIGEVQ